MRLRLPSLVLVAVAMTFAPAALAQTGTTDKGAAEGGSAAGAPKPAGEKRRDPKGVTGVSPTTERINEGNAAYLARDYAKAVEKYQQAIEQEAQTPLGHYMLGQALVAQGKLDEAERAWQTGLRFVGENAPIKAKLLLVMADLRERQNRLDEADAAWKEYATFIGGTAGAAGYPATPPERQKAIATRKEMQTAYAQVKERIAQRERDATAGGK